MNLFQEFETQTKEQDPYMRLLKYIVIIIVIGLLCFGIFFGMFYLSINLPYVRANIAIDQAKGQITPLYDQLSTIASSAVRIKSKTGVQSGMYAFSLSDGADQYAHVWAKVNLESNAPTEEVAAPYRDFWTTKGFSEISIRDKGYIFQSPDESLVAGICQAGQNVTLPKSNYVAFIDYANGPRCDNPSGRLACIKVAYCAE